MPATMNASTTEGPARSAMAAAVRTNSPAPMMAPMPSATSCKGPSVRFSVPSPLAAASASRRSIDFVLNNEPATMPPPTVESETPRLYGQSPPLARGRHRPKRDFRQRRDRAGEHGALSQHFLIEEPANENASNFGDACRRDRPQHGAFA